jgi:hypothetical protein
LDRRDYQKGTMAASRRLTGNVPARAVKNPARRAACLADQRLFLKTYFAEKFVNPALHKSICIRLVTWPKASILVIAQSLSEVSSFTDVNLATLGGNDSVHPR